MKYISALLLFFNFYLFPGYAMDFPEITPGDLLKNPVTENLCQFIIARGFPINNIRLLACTLTVGSRLTAVGCGDQQNGPFQEAFFLTVQKPEAAQGKSYDVNLLHLGIISPGSLHLFDHNIYNNEQPQNNYQSSKILFMRKNVTSNKFELLEVLPDKHSLSIVASGTQGDMHDEGLVLTYGKTKDTNKIAPVLVNPTEETISAFIKAELGQQDLDINYSKLTTKTGLLPLISGVVLVTQHGIPAFEEAFFLSMKTHSYFLKSLGKFSCDTFNFLNCDNDSAVCTGKSPDSKDFQFIRARLSKYETTFFIDTHEKVSNTQVETFTHDSDLIFIVNHNNLGAKPLHDLSTAYLIEEGNWDNIINTRFKSINGKFYQITPSEDQQKYVVYTLQKVDERYQRIRTNVTTTEYIHKLLPDPENAANILAYQTGNLSQLTWRFCDESFGEMVSALSIKINSNLGELNKSSWHFSQIPLGGTKGQIEFDEIVFKKKDKEIKISCDNSGEIDFTALEGAKFIPLAKPEMRKAYDLEKFPIDYAVFRSPQAEPLPLPTVMLINGGPHVFIEHKKHADEINFFNHHGYHVVIPQGLFRRGYLSQYAINAKGKFGELDMELLRCVLRDLQAPQGITSQPVYIMGSSYGGYSCARLGFDSDLVKAAFVENAFLDLTTSLNNQCFWLKDGEDDVSKERRLRELSPALDAPLPKIPIFMVGIQNDVRCPITQSRAFANRLTEKNLPLTYLERSSGGHDSHFSHLELIKDFFESKYGVGLGHDRLEGYQVVVDSNQFFNK